MVQHIANMPTMTAAELIAANTLTKASGNREGQALMTRSTGFKVAEWIVGVLTLGIGAIPFEIYKSFKEEQALSLAEEVIGLKDELLTFKEGEAAEANITLHGQNITLSQDHTNKLTATFEDGRTINMPFGALQLAEKLSKDIVSHHDFYGKMAVSLILKPLIEGKKTGVNVRSLYQATLVGVLGEELGSIATLKTQYLGIMAYKALGGQIKSAHALESYISKWHKPNNINSEDCLDLLHGLEQAMKVNSDKVAKTVILSKMDYANTEIAKQDSKITQLRNFVADIIYDRDTWTHDDAKKPGERLLHTLTRHVNTMLLIYNNEGLIDKGGLPEPLQDALNDVFNSFAVKSALWTGEGAVKLLLDTAFATGKLADAEKKIDGALLDMVPDVETKITEAIDALFPGAEQVGDASLKPEIDLIGDANLKPENVPLTDAEIVAAAMKDKAKLDEMLEAAATDMHSDGYGKFMKDAMLQYFSKLGPIDKRAMIAASIRYSAANAAEGALLGAMLKGAGPIMQKMLQGFSTANMEPIFKDALLDMKANLAPIHEQIVKAQLYGMVEASKGSITKIEVVKSLGAASVGQAFLCKVTTPQSQEPVDCVIKLLRPDVQARADRERALFEEVANNIPGMGVTFAGQLQRIMDELDLTKEAKNVEISSVYENGPFTNVHTMKILPLIDTSSSSMALEKAPGVTLDAYYRDGKVKLEELIAQSNNAPALQVLEDAKIIMKMYNELGNLQQALQNGATTWVTEGIFGGGFYHGDLHAGNMMFDKDHGLTLIDYGNATSLTSMQQSNVTVMMAAATHGDTQKFLDGYATLLSPNGRTAFNEKKDALAAELDKIMSLGMMEDAGKRIALCLTTAAKMGIESPASIFNFSQCQMRLQGTMESMNAYAADLIKGLHTILTNMQCSDAAMLVRGLLVKKEFTSESILEWFDETAVNNYADGYVELHLEHPEDARPHEKETIGLRDIAKQILESLHSDVTFSACMGRVLQEHFGATVNRIGLGGAQSFLKKEEEQGRIDALQAKLLEQAKQAEFDKEWKDGIAKTEQINAQLKKQQEKENRKSENA